MEFLRHQIPEIAERFMKKPNLQDGFSIIELLVIMTVLTVLSAIAITSFSSAKKYAADDQAMLITDFLDEARQSALNQRRTFRVEINRTKKKITLINENDGASSSDDKIIKSVPLKTLVTVGEVPNNVLSAPTATSPIPVLDYVQSNYPPSSGDEKITLRFARSGRVLDTGTDNTGTGSLMRGATIYVFSTKDKTTAPEIIRAVTVLQSTGDTSILKCSFDTNGKCGNWKK